MAKRKSAARKSPRRRPRKSKLLNSSLLKAFVGLVVLGLLVAIVGLLAHFLVPPSKPSVPAAIPKSIPPVKEPIAKIPRFEVFPQKEIPPEKPPVAPPVPTLPQLPKVAIIIDDLGYDKHIAEQFSGIEAVLTFAILPHSPYQQKITNLAEGSGFDSMLHLPMEPMEYPAVDPGPGVLLTSMTPDQLIQQLEKNLDAVPFIKGVNNHMGSKMTAASSQMYQIFSVLKKRNLFFIDSRTTIDTLCKPSARLFQIPFAQRDVFLDHLQQQDFIRKQLKELVRIARRNGQAVGIGHAHSLTYQVLREALPELQKEVQLVPASEIVHPLG
jgi:polysaccharide deacetylase 2 family uncharacterized protein YibQ